jgi:hypothetical protein
VIRLAIGRETTLDGHGAQGLAQIRVGFEIAGRPHSIGGRIHSVHAGKARAVAGEASTHNGDGGHVLKQ